MEMQLFFKKSTQDTYELFDYGGNECEELLLEFAQGKQLMDVLCSMHQKEEKELIYRYYKQIIQKTEKEIAHEFVSRGNKYQYEWHVSHLQHGNLFLLIHGTKLDFIQIECDQKTRERLSKQMLLRNGEAIACLEFIENSFCYLFNNNEHHKLTGFSSEQIYGKQLKQVLGEPHFEIYDQNARFCLETHQSILFKGSALFNGTLESRMCRMTPIWDMGRTFILVEELNTAALKVWMRENHLSVTRFDEMFDAHVAIMLLIEPQTGDILEANQSAVQFYGYTREELIGMPIHKINTLSENEVYLRRSRVLNRQEDYFLFQHKLKNGQKRWVDVHSSPLEINGASYLFSIITDATKRVEMDNLLYREKELQKITMDSIGDCVVTTDETGKITYVNGATALATGWKKHEVLEKDFCEIFSMIHEYTFESVPNIVDTVLTTGKIQELANHTLLKTKSGRLIPIEDSAAPIVDKEGKLYGVVVIFRDVTLAKQKKKRIEFLSYHDTLTTVYNRNFYNLYMDEENLESKFPMGFLLGDVNGLKMTNDVFGHTLGDLLLKSIATTLYNCSEKEDIVIRWGGDEFLILIPNTNLKVLEDRIKQIKIQLSNIRINEAIEASVSFGTAMMADYNQSFDEVLKEAEEMMYQTKLFESKSMRGNTISALMLTLDEKSAETKEHTLRLKDLCIEIANDLGHHMEKKNRLSLLSVLHDIGKVGIPDHILNKPGGLTEEEWVIMRSHPEIGYRIASNVPELHVVADEILHHHEKWDGTGYPTGLKGEEIPINCRILAVVDAYDAMTNDRMYRKAMQKDEALKEIELCSGTQFDPEIVKVFLQMRSKK